MAQGALLFLFHGSWLDNIIQMQWSMQRFSPRCLIKPISLILEKIFQGGEKAESIFLLHEKMRHQRCWTCTFGLTQLTPWLLGIEIQNSLPCRACAHILTLTSSIHEPPSPLHLFMTPPVSHPGSRMILEVGGWANPVEHFNQIQKDWDHLRNWASRW